MGHSAIFERNELLLLRTAHAHGLLGLLRQRLLSFVGVSAHGVTGLLGGRFLALRLDSGSNRVGHSFDLVASLLGHGLLGLGLHRSSSLVGHRLTSSVSHCNDIECECKVVCMFVCVEREKSGGRQTNILDLIYPLEVAGKLCKPAR